MKFCRALALLPLAAAAPAPPSLGDVYSGAPNPSTVQIKGITYGRTGCPQCSLSYVIFDDQTTATLIFDSCVASIGPSVSVTENRKNYQLNVDITYPGGFQYSVFSADYRGYAAIDKGVTSALKSTYYFSSQTAQVSIPQSKFSEPKFSYSLGDLGPTYRQTSTEYDFVGPVDGDYLKYNTADSTPVI